MKRQSSDLQPSGANPNLCRKINDVMASAESAAVGVDTPVNESLQQDRRIPCPGACPSVNNFRYIESG